MEIFKMTPNLAKFKVAILEMTSQKRSPRENI